jgi:hypothetical protein
MSAGPTGLLVEGRAGAGKTTALCILSQVLRDADIRLCGFLTKELRRVLAALVSRKKCVVLINEDGACLDALSGSRGRALGPVGADRGERSAAVSGGPAVSRGQLYVGTADGRVIAYGLP